MPSYRFVILQFFHIFFCLSFWLSDCHTFGMFVYLSVSLLWTCLSLLQERAGFSSTKAWWKRLDGTGQNVMIGVHSHTMIKVIFITASLSAECKICFCNFRECTCILFLPLKDVLSMICFHITLSNNFLNIRKKCLLSAYVAMCIFLYKDIWVELLYRTVISAFLHTWYQIEYSEGFFPF